MTDKEKLNRVRAEVERLKETKGFLSVEQRELTAAYQARGCQEACDDILSIIDSMQKEPEFKVGDTLRRKSDGCHAKVIEVRNGNVRVESTDWDMWILNKEWELVEEPKKCMYSKDDYTDEDRKVLCGGCKEECKYSESDDFTKALAECIHQAQCNVFSPLVLAETWKDELIKLAKSEEPVSEDLGDYINDLSKQFPEVSFAKLSRIAVRVAKWQKEQIKRAVEIAREETLQEVKSKLLNMLQTSIDNKHLFEQLDDYIEELKTSNER